MQTRQRSAPDATNRSWLTFVAIAVLLIGSFLWRAITPAHEYPRQGDRFLTMGLDLLLIVCLVGLRKRVDGGKVLFGFALAAGVGLFLIRFTGDAQWATGHLVYYLEPR